MVYERRSLILKFLLLQEDGWSLGNWSLKETVSINMSKGIIASIIGKTLHVWRRSNGELIQTVREKEIMSNVSLKDNIIFTSGNTTNFKIWEYKPDIGKVEEIGTVEGHTETIVHMFSNDEWLLTSTILGETKVWNKQKCYSI